MKEQSSKDKGKCTKEQFYAWLQTQPKKVRNELLALENMYERGRKSLLEDTPTTLHEVVNICYDTDLAELYSYACNEI